VVSDYKSFVERDDIKAKLMSIKDYLNKPKLLATIAWDTSKLKNYELWYQDIGGALIGNSMWMDKMRGFGLMRGTAVLRLLLNANPFQQGKLLLHFLPCENAFLSTDTTFSMYNKSIASKRQQPCVELDCSDGGAVFKIPYIAPVNWYNLITQVFGWGVAHLSVMSPLAVGTGGVNAVDISIYLHFEDVELSAPMVPQTAGSGGGGPKQKFKAKVVGKDCASKELDAMEGGSLSSALKAGSIVATKLGEISAMSSLASPATWTLMAAAGLSNYNGWSKPTNNRAETLVSQQYDRYLASSDGVSNALPIALRSDNAVSVTDGLSVYEGDEMSFGFLYKVSTCIRTFQWPASASTGSSIVSFDVNPRNLYEVGVSPGTGLTTLIGMGPPIYYLANSFAYWRGSINVTFKLVKTDYHTGRLQLTWTPVTTPIATPPTIPDNTTGQYSLREIIDIKEGNEFTFNFPWLNEQNYLRTDQNSGFFSISILNELRAPDTCSQNVEILMYVSGGDDFELQLPGFQVGRDARSTLPFVPQTLMENTGDKEIISGVVGDAGIIKKHNVKYSGMSTGELPMNVKQFLSRSNQVVFKTQPGTVDGFAVWPWHNTLMSSTITTGTLIGPPVGPDLYSIFANMYAFYRGGVNITVKTTGAEAATYGRHAVVAGTLIPFIPIVNSQPYINPVGVTGEGGTNDYLTAATAFSGLQGTALSNANIGLASFKVPYFTKTKCSLVTRQVGNGGYISTDVSQPTVRLSVTSSGGFNHFTCLRSFADDFQLSYFIGCPPIFISAS